MVKPIEALAAAAKKAAARLKKGEPPAWVIENNLKWEFRNGRIQIIHETAYKKEPLSLTILLDVPTHYLESSYESSRGISGYGEVHGTLTRFHFFLPTGCHLIFIPRKISSYEDYQRLITEVESLVQRKEGWKK